MKKNEIVTEGNKKTRKSYIISHLTNFASLKVYYKVLTNREKKK